MRSISGIVCEATGDSLTVLYGENTGQGAGIFQNLEANAFAPFSSVARAAVGRQQVLRRFPRLFTHARLYRLQLIIAEHGEKEHPHLPDIGSFVTIGYLEIAHKLFGALVEGKPGQYPLPGSYFVENGHIGFNSLDDAVYVAQEIQRQAASQSRIARCQLDEIDA
ncbi:hypothetical protein HY491_02060 [Candidatus Woesearchaeota archaeon]|nr:hypothetical protein [Candidatus Woesearchaeota archaeon]